MTATSVALFLSRRSCQRHPIHKASLACLGVYGSHLVLMLSVSQSRAPADTKHKSEFHPLNLRRPISIPHLKSSRLLALYHLLLFKRLLKVPVICKLSNRAGRYPACVRKKPSNRPLDTPD
ncbi:hypothetical protein FA95DRAFT_1558402, partial [Auriscalpium vulgare]